MLRRWLSCAAVLSLSMTLPAPASCQTETILYNFASGTDITEPYYGLAFDSSGNLYGSSFSGGADAKGGVFQLSPNGTGWSESVLHSFAGGHSDGTLPNAEPVVDTAGNVYATTFDGGNTAACLGGCGVVIKLTQTSPGVWTESLVYVFAGHSQTSDGAHPLAIALNQSGYPLGVTFTGGTSNAGTFYQIVPGSKGGFIEQQLYDFANSDISAPTGGLAMDSAGNLYGTSLGGGAHNLGAVFELSPAGNGVWTETTIYSFATDGANGGSPYPNPNLAIDSQGNLYGTCRDGGVQRLKCGTVGCGFVFKLAKSQNGTWQEQTIWKFHAGNDGNTPWDGVVLDGAGNVYGTTIYGGGRGNGNCNAGTNILFCGTVYELTPQPDGSYAETILHRFASVPDGAEPIARLVLDTAGNLYGTTNRGGDASCGFGYGCGTVFKITP